MIVTLIDFSKGFNRIDHSKLIVELHRMNVPGWILRIIVSYLENRSLVIRYKGGVSEQANLPGGVGQGTLLGLWMFLIMMNSMAIGNESDGMIGKKITCGKQSVMEKCKKKWVDDLTIAHAVDLSKLC